MINLSNNEALGAAAIAAHKFSFKNREYLIRPQLCGCFHCLTIFHSTELKEDDFLSEDDGQYTAWCPYYPEIIGSDERLLVLKDIKYRVGLSDGLQISNDQKKK